MQSNLVTESKPWWHFGHVWLIISGPVLVIVACFITAYFVLTSPNELVNDTTYQQVLDQRKSIGGQPLVAGEAPAMQARNHAATGTVPLPK